LIATPAFLSLDSTTLMLSASGFADSDVGSYTVHLVPAITPYSSFLTTYDSVSVDFDVVRCTPTWTAQNSVSIFSHVNGAGQTTETINFPLQGACNYVLTQTVTLDTGLVASIDTSNHLLTISDSTVGRLTLTLTTSTTELATPLTFVETFYIDVTCPVSLLEYTQ
jgi:hypothetical protein